MFQKFTKILANQFFYLEGHEIITYLSDFFLKENQFVMI